jgi:hypothetical protein
MPDIIVNWLSGLLERAPELFILVIVAYDLRSQLIDCIEHQTQLTEMLFTRILIDHEK